MNFRELGEGKKEKGHIERAEELSHSHIVFLLKIQPCTQRDILGLSGDGNSG